MILNYLTGLFGWRGTPEQTMHSGLPPELRFPLFITGDGGSGRTTALTELARRAAADRRVMVKFSVESHIAASSMPEQRRESAHALVNFISTVAAASTERLFVLVDDIDCLDDEQVSTLLATTACADLVVSSRSNCLARRSDIWNMRTGSIVALRTTAPALAERLDAEGAAIDWTMLAQLSHGESFQIDLATGRVSSLTWPMPISPVGA